MITRYTQPSPEQWGTITARPTASFADLAPKVQAIFERVKNEGDAALRDFTRAFDKVLIDELAVSPADIAAAEAQLTEPLKAAITLAYTNIEKFHAAQQTAPIEVDTQAGVRCWQEKRPIERVGLYIPGGTAPLFSTLLMLAIPAKLAGCKEIILCSPPNQDGEIAPEIRYVAHCCGIEKLYRIGGAQAIAALTFGTETVPNVDKLFGPGNQYVTVAKQLATQYQLAIDMPAGPSELLVVADETCTPEFVAADLLSQAEHGPDSQVVLVSTSPAVLDAVDRAIAQQLPQLPREAIATEALKHAKSVYLQSDAEVQAFVNAYAPEHYSVCVRNPKDYLQHLQHAGSVFIGPYTPESAGDYASGTNHTLPTNGYARQYSGVNLASFQKAITFQEISPEGLQTIGPSVALMAAAEGLDAHKNAVTIRLNSLANA